MFSEPMINEMIGGIEAAVNSSPEIPVSMLIITAVISLIICLFGLKLIRIWNTICGLVFGAVIGVVAVFLLQQDTIYGLIIIGAAALILAVLAGVFKRFGAFLLCLGTVMEIIGMMQLQNVTWLAVAGVAGLVVAILTMIWLEPLVIIVTSLSGGIGFGNVIVYMSGLKNLYLVIAIYAATVILGLVVQFMMKSREIGRKEAKHARRVKEEISIESEIDKARSILEFDDDDEYEDDDEEE